MSDCVFCKIVSKQIPSQIIYEDDQSLAFLDITPQAPYHIIVIPKEHFATIAEIKDYKIIGHLFSVINKIAQEKGFFKDGFRVVLNQGRNAGQAVPHLHFHILAGRPLHWPPG